MENSKVSKKAKKGILAAGISLVCIGIISVVIVNTNQKAEANNDKAADNSSATIVMPSDITPNPISSQGSVNSNLGEKAFDPATESSRSEALTTYSKTSSTPSKPVIEGDSKNGSQPTNSALTDKNKKPSYTTTPKASTGSSTAAKQASSKSSGTSGKKSTSSTGSNYDPIFGNKRGTAHGEQTVVEGDWGEGEQVGIMD